MEQHLVVKRGGKAYNLGVNPQAQRLVLIDKGHVVKRSETDHYRMDAATDFEQAKVFIRGAFEQYIKAYPNDAIEVAEACHQQRVAAINKHQASPDYSWRLSMIIPVALDVFIKQFVPDYLRNDRLRHWMMREFKGFVVPDTI